MRAIAWDATQPVLLELRDFTLPVGVSTRAHGGGPPGRWRQGGPQRRAPQPHGRATFIYNVDGDSLIPDAGRGKYSKAYFRAGRYDNVFNNSIGHNVPRIGGKLQAPGPEFGGTQQFHGTIVEQSQQGGTKTVGIDFHRAYDLPTLTGARRTLVLDAESGVVTLRDEYAFDGEPLPIEEAFVSWHPVTVEGQRARITGERAAVTLDVLEPAGAVLRTESLEEACRANELEGVLTRLAIELPVGSTCFTMRITPTGLS